MLFEYGRLKTGNRYGVRYHIEDIYENGKTEIESRQKAKVEIEIFVKKLFPNCYLEVIRQEFHQPRYPFTCVMWVDTLFQLNAR